MGAPPEEGVGLWAAIGEGFPRRMLKSHPSHPPIPGSPRRAFHQAAFSPRKHPQRSPLGEQAVLAAWGGRVRRATPPVLSSAAALLDGHFEHLAEMEISMPSGATRKMVTERMSSGSRRVLVKALKVDYCAAAVSRMSEEDQSAGGVPVKTRCLCCCRSFFGGAAGSRRR